MWATICTDMIKKKSAVTYIVLDTPHFDHKVAAAYEVLFRHVMKAEHTGQENEDRVKVDS